MWNGPCSLAIKHDIALYAIHTNLDNVFDGVNGEIAARLGLKSGASAGPESRGSCGNWWYSYLQAC